MLHLPFHTQQILHILAIWLSDLMKKYQVHDVKTIMNVDMCVGNDCSNQCHGIITACLKGVTKLRYQKCYCLVTKFEYYVSPRDTSESQMHISARSCLI